MKTNLKKLFLLAIIFLTPNLVQAESLCSYSEQAELNNIVANVKANYETVDIYDGKVLDIDNPGPDGKIPEVDYYIKGFNINILNITEDIYVKVSNNVNSDTATFRYSDTKDGMATFQTREVDSLITYTIEVYSNKSKCVGELFRKFTVTTPIYNLFSEWRDCKENPEFYYCQEYLSSENISINEFRTKLQDYKVEKEEKRKEEEIENQNFLWNKIKKMYRENIIIINSIGILILISGVATTVILIKKKRSRVL